MADSLGDALPREMARVRELMRDYAELPNGSGSFAMLFMETGGTNAR